MVKVACAMRKQLRKCFSDVTRLVFSHCLARPVLHSRWVNSGIFHTPLRASLGLLIARAARGEGVAHVIVANVLRAVIVGVARAMIMVVARALVVARVRIRVVLFPLAMCTRRR